MCCENRNKYFVFPEWNVFGGEKNKNRLVGASHQPIIPRQSNITEANATKIKLQLLAISQYSNVQLNCMCLIVKSVFSAAQFMS